MVDYSNIYDGYWRRPDRIGESSFTDPGALARQILTNCGPGRILDIGCGMGALVRALLKQGADAYGVDVSSVAIDHCSSFMPSRFHVASVLALPFPDDSFDTLVSTDCLEHLTPEHAALALKEMHRVCRRSLFLYVATEPDRDGHWHLTVKKRGWWEDAAFAVGCRKHPQYYGVTPYHALETEGNSIAIPLEKLPKDALFQYPLSALLKQRDLHMDMSRETGRRSDAHMARYQLAASYVRDGDTVLDAACGMGYGSHLLSVQSAAAAVVGADLDRDGIAYATQSFASKDGRLSFCVADVQKLGFLSDDSIDVFASFETLEHVPHPEQLIAEAKRLLRPGGRFIVSVPNLWVDDTGRDPNPHHLQIYDWDRLYREISSAFLLESVFAQTAGGGMKLGSHPRSMQSLAVAAKQDTPAEWWIVVGMKDPLQGQGSAYQETSLTWNGSPPNIAAFARDYANPWLIRGMVSIGWRCTNEQQLEQMAAQVRKDSHSKVDKGAALCVLAYRVLSSPSRLYPANISVLIDEIDSYVQDGDCDHPQELRWIISNLYAKALLLNAMGNRTDALEAFEFCANHDPLIYSPLLATKTVAACWQAGLITFHDQKLNLARTYWRKGIELTEKALHGDWREIYGELEHPFRFGLKEAMEILDLAANCADAIHHTAIHGLSKGLPSKSTPTHRLVDLEQRFAQSARQLDKLQTSPCGRLQRAIEEKSPPLRRYLRIAYLLSLILLPSSFTRLLSPLKMRFEKRRQPLSS
jgi:ubiquinone/menaquinone biosynthesis C-methylase UbiE